MLINIRYFALLNVWLNFPYPHTTPFLTQPPFQLVAEYEEENTYTPAAPPEIRNIFSQVAGESSAAGSDQSAERAKPHNINDSSYFSLSNDKERMAWIDRWVQDGDPSSSPGPPSRASPVCFFYILQYFPCPALFAIFLMKHHNYVLIITTLRAFQADNFDTYYYCKFALVSNASNIKGL